jgi:hypothetical protein
VAETEGFPLYRHQERDGEDITELWSYPEAGRVYVFRDGVLVGTRLY